MNEWWQVCPHLTYDRTKIGVKTTYRQEFMNCSKILVSTPWSVEGVWSGKYAKWFENCHRSQAGSATSTDPQVTATFWAKDFWDTAVTDHVFLGTVDPTSDISCYRLPGVPVYSAEHPNGEMITPENQFMLLAYKTIFNYLYMFVDGSKSYGNEFSLF